ncbi:hypothetical protein [Bradyrhizobium cenepequi]|uniref:hypothetical protein n=1 Tax=Bradyrhizobium cenepequi TaxID=2821403 RepID=UPI0040643B24
MELAQFAKMSGQATLAGVPCPLINCTTAQGKPCATHRMIMPKADEDFPLPAPVWTMMSPFSPLMAAIIRSRATFASLFGRMAGIQPGFGDHGFVLSGIRFARHLNVPLA